MLLICGLCLLFAYAVAAPMAVPPDCLGGLSLTLLLLLYRLLGVHMVSAIDLLFACAVAAPIAFPLWIVMGVCLSLYFIVV